MARKTIVYGIAITAILIFMFFGCSKDIRIEKIEQEESEYDLNAIMYPDTPECNCPDLNLIDTL